MQLHSYWLQVNCIDVVALNNGTFYIHLFSTLVVALIILGLKEYSMTIEYVGIMQISNMINFLLIG